MTGPSSARSLPTRWREVYALKERRFLILPVCVNAQAFRLTFPAPP